MTTNRSMTRIWIIGTVMGRSIRDGNGQKMIGGLQVSPQKLRLLAIQRAEHTLGLDEDPLSRMQTTANGIVISHTLSPTSPAFGHSLVGQSMVNPPYSGIGAMIAGYEDAGLNSGLAIDNGSLNKLWDIVAEQSGSLMAYLGCTIGLITFDL